MNDNKLFIGFITALAVGCMLYFVKQFHDELKEVESRLDYQAGVNSVTDTSTPKTPCNCGSH